MTKELKPCPFCGGEATVEPFNDENWFASCNECDATIEDFPNRSEAAKAWNARYKRTCNMVAPNRETMPYPRCSACGAPMLNAPNRYCAQCGAEVVDG